MMFLRIILCFVFVVGFCMQANADDIDLIRQKLEERDKQLFMEQKQKAAEDETRTLETIKRVEAEQAEEKKKWDAREAEWRKAEQAERDRKERIRKQEEAEAARKAAAEKAARQAEYEKEKREYEALLARKKANHEKMMANDPAYRYMIWGAENAGKYNCEKAITMFSQGLKVSQNTTDRTRAGLHFGRGTCYANKVPKNLEAAKLDYEYAIYYYRKIGDPFWTKDSIKALNTVVEMIRLGY